MAIRTICIPIAECISHTKSELYAMLRRSLDASRSVANIAATECLRQDDITQDKCGKLYTYPRCKDMYEGCSFMVASVCRAVEKCYKQDRWQMKRGIRASRSYRSMPWPMLNNASCSTLQVVDEGEYLTAKIKLLNGHVVVRLAGGSNYRDQIRGLRKAIELDAICDSKLWIDRSHKSILGISVDLPNKEAKERDGVVQVVSGIDYLAAMIIPRQQHPFVINADDVQQWKAESVRRNQRWRQARKQGIDRRRLREESSAFAEKMQRRLKSKTHEIASQIVAKADRVNAKIIELNFTIKSYLPSFPWYELASKIEYKANDAGIEVLVKTQSVTEPQLESPHVYFILEPHSWRVKIGKTKGGKGRIESYMTMNPDCVVLAIDNQPQTKLSAKEKHYHAMFDNHRVIDRNKIGNELFIADPVIAWLRAVEWIGNAGNLSQIAQVLDVSRDASRVGHLQADSKCLRSNESTEVLAEGQKQAGIFGVKTDGPRSGSQTD